MKPANPKYLSLTDNIQSVRSNTHFFALSLNQERHYTFDEMVNVAQCTPQDLKRTVSNMSQKLCLYSGIPEGGVVDLNDSAIMENTEQTEEGSTETDIENSQEELDVNRKNKEDETKENQEEDKKDPRNDPLQSFNFENDEDIISVEDIAKISGLHPLCIERNLYRLALSNLEDETEIPESSKII